MKEPLILPNREFLESYNSNTQHSIKFVKFKITGQCNLRCDKCDYWKKQAANKNIWTTEKIKDIIDQLAKLKTKRIDFSGGEVTMRSDLVEIIEHCSKRGIKSKITTNGILIDKSYAIKLCKAGLNRINFSLDYDDSNEHDTSVGLADAWIKTTNAIKYIKKAQSKLKSKTVITMACVVTKKNYYKLDKIALLAGRLGVKAINYLVLNKRVNIDNALKIEFNEIGCNNNNLRDKFKDIQNKYGIIINNDALFLDNYSKSTIYNSKPCYVPWLSFYISLKGKIHPCCERKDYAANIGSVFDNSIQDLINNNKFKQFRESCKPPIKSVTCNQCTDWIDENTKIFNEIINIKS